MVVLAAILRTTVYGSGAVAGAFRTGRDYEMVVLAAILWTTCMSESLKNESRLDPPQILG